MTMRISCSIVSYKSPPSQIANALRSVKDSCKQGSLDVMLTLVDNSPDNALSKVAQHFGARYIHLPHNPGFGAAHNVALGMALELGISYHLVLNPDVYFDEEVLPALVGFMEDHRDVGLVMPQIRYPDGSTQHLCKLLPTPVDLLMRRFAPSLYESSGRLARYELHDSGYRTVMEVPTLSGCFMFLRTKVLRKVGGFDERFFMYLEDVDLSRRIGEVAKTVFYPEVAITHEYVKGSYKSTMLLFQHLRSAVHYFNKWGWIFDRDRDLKNNAVLGSIAELKLQTN